MATLNAGVATLDERAAHDLGGLYLTFHLKSEICGIPILTIQEIIGMMPVTKIPKTPDFVRGVVNLRGKVIPVVDLRSKFGMESQEDTERTCIVVVRVDLDGMQTITGLIVDSVSEVVNIPSEQTEPPPELGASTHCEYLDGVGKIGDKVVLLLDVTRIVFRGEANGEEKE